MRVNGSRLVRAAVIRSLNEGWEVALHRVQEKGALATHQAKKPGKPPK